MRVHLTYPNSWKVFLKREISPYVSLFFVIAIVTTFIFAGGYLKTNNNLQFVKYSSKQGLESLAEQ